MALAECGWVSVRSFSKVKLILEIISPLHNKLLISYLISLHLPSSCHTYLCLTTPDPTTPPTPLPLNADLLELHTPPPSETPEQDEDMPPTQQPPLTPPPHAAALLVSYRLLAYLSWPNEYDHPRQRLLEAIAGGLHLRALDALGPYLTAALDDFPRIFSPLFNQLLSLTSSRRTFILLSHLPCSLLCTRTPLLTLSFPQSFPSPIYLLLQPSKNLLMLSPISSIISLEINSCMTLTTVTFVFIARQTVYFLVDK